MLNKILLFCFPFNVTSRKYGTAHIDQILLLVDSSNLGGVLFSFVLWLVYWNLDFCFFVAFNRVPKFSRKSYLGSESVLGSPQSLPFHPSLNQRGHFEEKKVTSVKLPGLNMIIRVSKPL